MIRHATANDLEALLRLEQRSFESDRLSRRSLRHALTHPRSNLLLVDADRSAVHGYALVRLRAGSRHARLYSLAIDPAQRGGGRGRTLLAAAERAARARGASHLRLELRKDNAPALKLYRRMGYQEFGSYLDYYQDHMDAWRMQKSLATGRASSQS